jgi:hypothetical protein
VNGRIAAAPAELSVWTDMWVSPGWIGWVVGAESPS